MKSTIQLLFFFANVYIYIYINWTWPQVQYKIHIIKQWQRKRLTIKIERLMDSNEEKQDRNNS